VAAQDTLGAFLEAIKARYPDSGTRPELPPPAPAIPPELPGLKPASPQLSGPLTIPPPLMPDKRSQIVPPAIGDPISTGSINSRFVNPILPPTLPKGVRLHPDPIPIETSPRLPQSKS
jgi:hypothetical protein